MLTTALVGFYLHFCSHPSIADVFLPACFHLELFIRGDYNRILGITISRIFHAFIHLILVGSSALHPYQPVHAQPSFD